MPWPLSADEQSAPCGQVAAAISTRRGKRPSWDSYDSKTCDQEPPETPVVLSVLFWI